MYAITNNLKKNIDLDFTRNYVNYVKKYCKIKQI